MNEVLAGLIEQITALKVVLEAEVKAAHDAGFAEGVASVSVGEKIYSQEELDALIAPLQAKIEELTITVSAMQVEFEAKVAEAVAKVKADLLAAYESEQASESAAESVFKELLK